MVIGLNLLRLADKTLEGKKTLLNFTTTKLHKIQIDFTQIRHKIFSGLYLGATLLILIHKDQPTSMGNLN